MIRLIRTSSDDENFIALIKQLDKYLAEINGEQHGFYDQFNKVDKIKNVVVVYEYDLPVGCGAIKQFDSDKMEIKRMYTLPEKRGKGIATLILNELEKWAAELSFKKCILETGKQLKDAISLYEKNSYKIIPNYGQYVGVENSVCFEKMIKTK